MAIGRLVKVPLRELWKHEARGFSAWLEQNLDHLSEAIDLQLSEPEREVGAGAFDCDLVAEDEQSNRVIIENQLEESDHDHLGKIITYLTNLEAKTAVWICRRARPEHVTAITWLNETTPDDVAFYLVRLDAYKIGTSDPAPLFTLIVGPSPESKSFGQQKKELAQRHILRLRFWEGLLKKAREAGQTTHSGRSPTKDSWLPGPSGRSGFAFTYTIWMKDQAGVELFIDTGNRDENKRAFDTLAKDRSQIETTFGAPLDWERLDERRGSRVRYLLNMPGLTAEEATWAATQDAMIEAMGRLVSSLRSRIPSL